MFLFVWLWFVQNSDDKQIDIEITSASLQPFTEQQWRINQQHIINTVSTWNNSVLGFVDNLGDKRGEIVEFSFHT